MERHAFQNHGCSAHGSARPHTAADSSVAAGPLPQEPGARHVTEERLRGRLPHYRQGLIRQELEGILLALFPCWTAAQCRAVLREPVFDGDVAEAVPPVRAGTHSQSNPSLCNVHDSMPGLFALGHCRCRRSMLHIWAVQHMLEVRQRFVIPAMLCWASSFCGECPPYRVCTPPSSVKSRLWGRVQLRT